MKRFRKVYLLMLGFALIGILSSWQKSDAQTKPLTYPEINTALNTKLPNKSFKSKTELINWLIAQIKERRVDKTLTQDREDDLRQAGATNELLETIRQNSPGSWTTPAKTPSNTDKTFKNSLEMEFVRISSGTFTMGAPRTEDYFGSEKPHRVTISRNFYMGKYEVTQGQWKAVMGNNPSKFSECGDDCPVENISWQDVQAFIQKLNAKNEGMYRLPTEAEWEYAARAGTTTPFAVGNGKELSSDDANFDAARGRDFVIIGKSLEKTVRVGSYRPNAWGLYDMHGNVAEWCADWFNGNYYSKSPKADPTGPDSGKLRIRRGGSWIQQAAFLRSASRMTLSPDDKGYATGFRLVRE